MRKIFLSVLSVICSFSAFGQTINSNNPISPAVPFVSITNNARIMGFGDIACVSSEFYSDAGLFQNPAILSGNSESAGINFSYFPWRTEEMNLKSFGAYYTINPKHSFAITGQYFNLGEITLVNDNGDYIESFKPIEYYYQLHYRYALSEKISLGAGTKYIRSKLGNYKENTISFDVGFSYRNICRLFGADCKYNVGAALTNFGPRVDYYNDNKTHQPTTLMIGALLNPTFILNENVKLNVEIAYQAEKLLVPTPPIYLNGNPDSIISGKNPDISPFRALYQSFYDAPGGFKEEWHEIIHKFGNEYRLSIKDNFHLAFRWGIFREHETKGNRKLNNTGFSFMVYGFYLDVAKYNHRVDNFDTKIISIGYRNTLGNLKELLN